VAEEEVPVRPGFGYAGIKTLLPQRYPLLLVDRVLSMNRGRFIRTIKAITGCEPCYAGVGDGAEPWRYAYPAPLIIESLGQSAALLWLADHPAGLGDDRVLMFAGARDFSFEGSAYPGDVMRHEVRLENVIADTVFASGETWVGQRRIATVASMIAVCRPVHTAVPFPSAASADGEAAIPVHDHSSP
jgi:3-hydroxyacyl-[acyl-carrier-protein] dehydratase